jgi:predicted ATPase/transcriptional regulator with XRE-family HTH domain
LAVLARKEAAMDDIASFGRWLKLRRVTLDLTQAELARLVGCAVVTIRKIEADERRPSPLIAERLAQHLALGAEERAAFLSVARAVRSPLRLPPPGQATAPAAQHGYLPAPPTPLIGRDHAVAEVRAQLRGRGVRLLTLTGPGGVGKTRLALQAALELAAEFTDGAWFVNLASIRDPALLVAAIAHALVVWERPGVPLSASLAGHLRARELLLLLDNFEQVATAAPLIGDLLAAAPGLTVLATSRRALHLSGEHEFAVLPLDLPPSGTDAPDRKRNSDAKLDGLVQPASYLRYPSVELFVARARAVRPTFVLTSENAPVVAEICVRLDGLPLAIELAAAHSKLFSPQALLARLDHRLNLLTAGPRDLPPRQQTLRDEIAWSYGLLSVDEQLLFARLAVFVGGWSLDAAQFVCAANAPPQEPAAASQHLLDGLAALLDQNLLHQEEIHGEQRFSMLETIREYALEQLALSGEAEAVRARHAGYCLALAERAEPELHGSRPSRWLKFLDVEQENLRAALAWCLDDSVSSGLAHGVTEPRSLSPSELGLRLAAALGRFWELRGRVNEGHRWLATALARAPRATVDQQGVHAKAMKAAANLVGMMGDNTAARSYIEAGLALYRALGDKAGIAGLLFHLGVLAWHPQDHAAQRARFEESLALYRELDDKSGIAATLGALAGEALSRGDFAPATALYEESLARARELEDKVGIQGALLGLGSVAVFEGRNTRAIELLEPSLALARELEDAWPISTVLIQLGQAALAQGELSGAAARLEEALALVLADGSPPWISAAWAMRSLGAVMCHQGAFERAMLLYRDALTIYRDGDDRWGIVECLEGFAVMVCGQGQQQQDEADAARRFAAAARWLGAATADRAITSNPISPASREEVGRAKAAARAALGEAAFAAAWETGTALPLKQAAVEALLDGGSPCPSIPNASGQRSSKPTWRQ